MKAIVMKETGGSEKLLFEDVAMPELEEGQVLVKVHAASVNLIDTIIREGSMPPGMMPELPFILGVEATGTVEDANGTSFEKGQKVAHLGLIGTSAYAEYMAVQADKLIKLTESIELAPAASGGVGTALIQLLKHAGIRIVALERKTEKVENAIKLGADHAFNTSDSDWVLKIESEFGANAINYVFNPVAGDSTRNDLELLATLGHIVIFGFLAGADGSDIQMDAYRHFGKSPIVSISEIYATYTTNFGLVRTGLEALYGLLETGKINPIFETMPLAKASEAHDKLEQGLVRGKLLLTNA